MAQYEFYWTYTMSCADDPDLCPGSTAGGGGVFKMSFAAPNMEAARANLEAALNGAATIPIVLTFEL
jgi:hypothetical protein